MAATCAVRRRPDGLDPALKASADETLRLSDLTLPMPSAGAAGRGAVRAWSVTPAIPITENERARFYLLASQSPRRRQLLDQLGVRHELLLPTRARDAERWSGSARRTAADYVQRVTALKLKPPRKAEAPRLPARHPLFGHHVALGGASSASRPMRPRPARCCRR